MVRKQVKLIQHRDGGIVGEILVANGDERRRGRRLIRLDETQTKAELGVLRTAGRAQGRRTRDVAERDGAVPSSSIPISRPTRHRGDRRGETRLFNENRAVRRPAASSCRCRSRNSRSRSAVCSPSSRPTTERRWWRTISTV